MRLCLAVSALALSTSAAMAQVTETDVAIPSQGVDMVGTLTVPDGVSEPPVVILFHGFTGSRDELEIPSAGEGIFTRTARALAEAGYASLRIDFVGSGDSPGDYADTTFDGQVGDAIAAYDWLEADDRFDDIFLLGWSQGGLVAATAAGRLQALDEAPEGVALWAAVADAAPTFRGILGDAAVDEGLAGAGPVTATLPWGAEVTLNPGFFAGLTAADPLGAIATYPGPLFVAHGTTDPIVPFAAQERFLSAHEGPEASYSAEMDHSFDVFTDTTDLDAMIAATIAFLDDVETRDQ